MYCHFQLVYLNWGVHGVQVRGHRRNFVYRKEKVPSDLTLALQIDYIYEFCDT